MKHYRLSAPNRPLEEEFKNIDHWKKFLILEEQVAQAYNKAIMHYQGSIWEEVLRIGTKKLVDVANCIYFRNKAKVLKDYHLTDEDSLFLNGDFSELVHYNSQFFRSPFYFGIRWLKNLLVCNLGSWPRLFKKFIWFNHYSISQEGLMYARTSKDFGLVIPYFVTLFKPYRAEPDAKTRKKLEEITNLLVGNIKALVSDFDIDSDTEIQLAQIINTHHFSFYNDYLTLRSRSYLPKTIVLCSNSKTHVRMISQAILHRGGCVVASTHGEPLVYDWQKVVWMELLLCSEFLEYDKNLASDLAVCSSSSAFHLPEPPVIKPLQNTYHLNVSYQKPASLKYARKALLVGNAFLNVTFSSVSSFEPILQMHIETRILQSLSRFNLKTDYKKHPGGILKNKIRDLYQDITDTIEVPFEEVIEDYDLIVFYYTKTSTIKTALESNKDILIVDLGLEKFGANSGEVINQRCFNVEFNHLDQGLSLLFS